MVPGIERKKKLPHARNLKEVSRPHKTFKKSRKESGEKEAPRDIPSSPLLQDDDPVFTRGGASLLSRDEVAEAGAEAEAEFDKEESQFGRKRKKDGRIKKPETQEDLGSLFGEGISGKLPRFSNRITSKVGLCHVSEISDESIDDLHALYKAGDRVRAKILKVDEAKNKISLGTKQSYFEDGSDNDMAGTENNENGIDANDGVDIDMVFTSLHEIGDTELIQEQFRALVPPLQVSLDESDTSDNDDNVTCLNVVAVNGDDAVNKKKIKIAKKKVKEERFVK